LINGVVGPYVGILKAGNSNSTTWGQLEKDALIDFGSFELDRINPWSVIDLLAFVGMGIVGGLFGTATPHRHLV